MSEITDSFKETEIGMLPAEFNAETQRRRDAEKENSSAPPRLGDSAFNETEIGLLPVEWEVVNLGKVAHINLGQSPPSSTYNTVGEGLPFLQGKTTFGRVFPTPERWCSAPKRIAEPGSVLISVRAPVGDVNIAQDKYCIGRGLTALNGETSLDNWFLFYLLIFSKPRLESKSTGSTFKSINKGILKSFPIPLPPLPEQRRIAGALRTIQEAIAAQEDVIAAARELKRSLMERLFTYGPGAEPAPTKETEIGEIPEHWEVTQLGEITKKPQYGYTQSASEESIGPKFLRITDITESGVNWATVPYCECGDDDLEKYRLAEGDILFARTGATTGKSHLIDSAPADAVFASYLIRVRAMEEINSAYLHAFFGTKAYWRQIGQSRTGSAQAGVNASRLSNLTLPSAPQREQQQIASTISVIDTKIAAEEQRKAALEEVFRSALEQLMTGQIRLNAEAQRR